MLGLFIGYSKVLSLFFEFEQFPSFLYFTRQNDDISVSSSKIRPPPKASIRDQRRQLLQNSDNKGPTQYPESIGFPIAWMTLKIVKHSYSFVLCYPSYRQASMPWLRVCQRSQFARIFLKIPQLKKKENATKKATQKNCDLFKNAVISTYRQH